MANKETTSVKKLYRYCRKGIYRRIKYRNSEIGPNEVTRGLTSGIGDRVRGRQTQRMMTISLERLCEEYRTMKTCHWWPKNWVTESVTLLGRWQITITFSHYGYRKEFTHCRGSCSLRTVVLYGLCRRLFCLSSEMVSFERYKTIKESRRDVGMSPLSKRRETTTDGHPRTDLLWSHDTFGSTTNIIFYTTPKLCRSIIY